MCFEGKIYPNERASPGIQNVSRQADRRRATCLSNLARQLRRWHVAPNVLPLLTLKDVDAPGQRLYEGSAGCAPL